MARALTRMQHIDPHRKYLLRRHLLRWAKEGPAYVPFIGDGDICVGGSKPGALPHERYPMPGLYNDRFIYGADLDPQRVVIARSRIPHGRIRVANCDVYPFADLQTGPIAVADFDAWNEPWPAFRSWFEHAEKAEQVVIFFTDAHRLGIMADGTHIRPDGSKVTIQSLTERQAVYYFYLSKHVWPWFEDYIRPYRVVDKSRYVRGMITYWGAAIRLENGATMARGKLSNFKGKKAAPFKSKGKKRSPGTAKPKSSPKK